MSKNHFASIYFLFLLTFSYTEELTPLDLNSLELLKVHGKNREYHNLYQSRINYIVEGPCVLDIYSRLAFPELAKKIPPYKFSVNVMGENYKDSLVIKQYFRKDKKVKSLAHPKHSFTLAGKDIINIPKGKHHVEFSSIDSNSKVLLRIISKPFKRVEKVVSVQAIRGEEKKILRNRKDDNSQYFSLNKLKGNHKLSFEIKGPRMVQIYSRLGSPSFGKRDYYQFKIRREGKLKGTYHMFAQKSDKWMQILPDEKSDNSVSVKRKSFFEVPKGSHSFEIELISPSEKDVFFKVQQEK